MKSDHKQRFTAPQAPVGSPKELLVVREGENLHLLARFFQAMLLNFLKAPGKVKAIKRLNLTVSFVPTGHPGSAVTLTFIHGHVMLEGGIGHNSDIKIMGETAVLMKLSRMPSGPAIVKYLMTHEGKDLIFRVRSGDLKIQGIVRHPFGMMNFSKFMAPNVN